MLRWSKGARRLHERRGDVIIPNDGTPEHALERLLELCDEVAAASGSVVDGVEAPEI